jgi:hypothetical protein
LLKTHPSGNDTNEANGRLPAKFRPKISRHGPALPQFKQLSIFRDTMFERNRGHKEMKRLIATVILITPLCQVLCAPNSFAQAPDERSAQTHHAEALEKQLEDGKQESAKQDQWLRNFAAMPFEQRFAIWRDAYAHPKLGLQAARLRHLIRSELTIDGVDVVPYLSQAVRDRNKIVRIEAVGVLTDMDRFVPKEKFIVPFRPDIFSPAGGAGSLNPYMTVDGRRIGRIGLEAVNWAITQSRDKRMSLYAALWSGRFLGELRQQSLETLMAGWRSSTIKARGRIGFSRAETEILSLRAYNAALLERGREIVPVVAAMLDDPDPWVRGETKFLLLDIDREVIRLRTLPDGKQTIDRLHGALLKGGMKPLPPDPKQREQEWIDCADQLLEDRWRTDAGSSLGMLAFALNNLYSDNTTQRPPPQVLTVYQAVPKMRDFLTYLTMTDPNFPSWGFVDSYIGGGDREMFHPNYAEKIKRYHDAWISFVSSSAGSASADICNGTYEI